MEQYVSFKWLLTNMVGTLAFVLTCCFTLNGDVQENKRQIGISSIRLDRHDKDVEELKLIMKENDQRIHEKLDYIIQELNNKEDRNK